MLYVGVKLISHKEGGTQTEDSVDKENQLDVTYVLFFISLLLVAQHVSGNHVPIFRS